MKRKGRLNIYKDLSLVIILIFTLFFYGCSDDRVDNAFKTNAYQVAGEIVETKLTDREKEVLQGLDIDKYFMFDANIKDKNIKSIDFWADYYEKGSFKNKCSGIGTNIQASQDKNIKMIFSTQKSVSNNSEEKWTFSVLSSGSVGKGSTSIKIPEKIQGINWINIKASEIVIGREVILAVIAGSEGNIGTSISIDALNENDEAIKNQVNKELLKNDCLYIIKCRFK